MYELIYLITLHIEEQDTAIHNRDTSLKPTNHVQWFKKGVTNMGPPLWSSGQSSWLQIRKHGVRFPALPEIKVVGLERGPLSLVSTTEGLLDRKVAAPV
jgi:hypothetical protein